MALDAYIRVSQTDGREGERYISPSEQRRVIEGFGAALGVEVLEENVSGSLAADKRRLGELIARCERGDSEGIIVAALDRLTRGSSRIAEEIFERMDNAGARLVAVQDGIDTARADDDGFTLRMLALIANREWKRHKRNWKAGQRHAIEERGQHLAAHVPVGYARHVAGNHPGTGKPYYSPLYPDAEVAPVVRELFQMRSQGATWRECRALFERHNVPNRNGEQGWSERGLQRVIKSRVYLGEAFMGDIRKEGAHDAIIDPHTWEAAQSTGRPHVRPPSDASLLTGLLFCAGCGGTMQYKHEPKTGRRRYVCGQYRKSGAPCTLRASVRADEAERIVEHAFLATTPLYLLPREHADNRPLEHERDAAHADFEAWMSVNVATVGVQAFEQGATRRKARMDEADETLRIALAEEDEQHDQLMLLQQWDSYSNPEKRRWMKNFGVRVTIERGRQPLIERATMTRRDTPLDLTTVADVADH